MWGLLAVVPVLLYFFRRKSKTVKVSTLVFFKTLAKEHQESAWLRRLKKLLSLLLTLLILFAAVFALVKVVFAPKAGALRNVVILIDRSASMAAEDTRGRSRMEEAKEFVRGRLAGLPESVGVSLIAYDARPEVLQPRTFNRREILRSLDAVNFRPVEDRERAAMSLAKRVAMLETPAKIWRISDSAPLSESEPVLDAEEPDPEPAAGDAEAGNSEGESAGDDYHAMPEGVEMDSINVALAKPVNVGITAFQIRKLPMEHSRHEAYIQVMASDGSKDAIKAKLEVRIGGALSGLREFELKPGARAGFLIPVEGAEGQVLKVILKADGDCFALDDEAITKLGEARPIIAAWISPSADPYTEIALQSISKDDEVIVYHGGSESWPLKEQVDVVIFEGWVPDQWPEDIPAVVINPPGSSGPVKAIPIESGGLPHDSIRVTNDRHPVLFRVNSRRVSITQTGVIDSTGSLEPLWLAGNEPVLLAGEVRGQRLVVMAFSARDSEFLPLTASYPLLIGNALYWCAEDALQGEGVQQGRPGDLVNTGGEKLKWTQIGRTRVAPRADVPNTGGEWVELDRLGLWQTESGAEGSALLLSARETNLGGAPNEDAAADTARAARGRSVLGDITWLFLWLIPLILILESYLFHRHSVY